MTDFDVAIIGAGPTGLTLACELLRRGVSVVLFEKREGPSTLSKALVVQARTWEVLDTLDCGQAVLDIAQPMTLVEAHVDGRPVPPIRFPDDPRRRPLMLRQSQTEGILLRRLAALGGSVRWRHALLGFETSGDHVRLTVDGHDGRTQPAVRFLVGCDGAHSAVRKALGLPFDGDSYPQDFVQIDCHVGGDGLPDDRILAFLDADRAQVTMPLGEGVFRVIQLRRRRPEGAAEVPEPHEFEAVFAAHGRNIRLHDVSWAVRFRLDERMVPHHRVGPVFLAGDAAHVHTPAGGLGMNTGIQDAQNLGWKLAMVLKGEAGEALLASYDHERHLVAAEVLATSRGFFTMTLGDQWVVKKLRRFVVPFLLGSAHLRQRAIQRVNQLDVGARGSPVVDDRRGSSRGPRAGDRAPDAPLGDTTVHRLLRAGGHLVIFVGPGAALAARARLDLACGPALAVDDAGFLAAYHVRGPETLVIRPDGVIGFRGRGYQPGPIREFFARYFVPGDARANASMGQWARRVGLLLSALPGLMLVSSAIMKLTHQPQMQAVFEHLGFPTALLDPIGAIELVCVALYLVPATAVPGAVLLTGYLGGAIAAHVRVGDAFMPPLILGVALWAGLYLRNRRLREACLAWSSS